MFSVEDHVDCKEVVDKVVVDYQQTPGFKKIGGGYSSPHDGLHF